MKKLAKYPNIDTTLIKILFDEYEHSHSKEIRDQLITELYPLCFYIINRYIGNPGIDDELLISYSVEGLIRGVESYDSTKVQYILTYIDNSISRFICKGIGESYQVGISFASRFNTLRKIAERYYGETIKENVDILDEILEMMSKEKTISEKKIDEIKFNILLKMIDVSDNKKIDNDLEFDDTTLYTEVFDKDYLEKLKKDVENMLSTFTNCQREIFIRRFGLLGNEPQLFQKIADEIGCEKGNVWNICSKKLKTIRSKSSFQQKYESYENDEIDINSPRFGKRKVRK